MRQRPPGGRLLLAGALCFTAGLAGAQPYAYIPNETDGNVSVVDTATLTVVDTVAVEFRPFGVAVHPDGETVYVGNAFGDSVSVIDAATNSVVTTITVGLRPVGVAVHPDGSRVYVAQAHDLDGRLTVIDTASNTVEDTLLIGEFLQPHGVAVDPDGSRVYVTNEVPGELAVIDTGALEIVATVGVGERPLGVAPLPDGSRIYVANRDSGDVTVIDGETLEAIATVEAGLIPYALAVHPNGRFVYVSLQGEDRVARIDAQTSAVTAILDVEMSPAGVAVHPDRTAVWVANALSGTVSLVAPDLSRILETVSVGGGPSSFGHFIGPLPTLQSLRLAITGECPGVATIRVNGATPEAQVFLVRGPREGSDEIPTGPCAGTQLDVSDATPVTILVADEKGQVRFEGSVGPLICGSFFQATDLATCATSNVVFF